MHRMSIQNNSLPTIKGSFSLINAAFSSETKISSPKTSCQRAIPHTCEMVIYLESCTDSLALTRLPRSNRHKIVRSDSEGIWPWKLDGSKAGCWSELSIKGA